MNTRTEVNDASSSGMSKQSIRGMVWTYLEENGMSLSPRQVYDRIPNFEGAFDAAQRLGNLEVFRNAKTLLVNPDKPLERIRYLAALKGKELVVPVPRLQSNFLTRVDIPECCNKSFIQSAITLRGLSKAPPANINSEMNIDLFITGSVAVSRSGLRIGEGHGYTDLLIAVLSEMKALNKNSLIVTLVHDYQVLDHIPTMLFGVHDAPVDIIVTPTETIMVSGRLRRPTRIMWNLISERRLNTVKALKKIKEDEEAAGKIIILKEAESDYENEGKIRFFINNKM